MSQRIKAIEFIRGLAMLGVLGIHAGAYSLDNPHVNIHLFALLEIISRFSVPIFFFVSAFGLFFHHNIDEKFNYSEFMRRRLRTVLIPYITWSCLYMMHYTLIYKDTTIWSPVVFIKFLLFGLASYQLYFLVILLWFYALMPLWRRFACFIIKAPVRNLGILLFLQIIFNYYSCYIVKSDFSNHLLNIAVQYRLSYIVFHYIFIFMLGAVFALKYEYLRSKLYTYKKAVYSFFAISLLGILANYYYLLYFAHYTPEQAVNTVQQLSPPGIIYTLAAALFFFILFSSDRLPSPLSSILDILGKYSYPIYLVHPFAMFYIAKFLSKMNLVMTAVNTIIFYLLALAISLGFGIALKHVGTSIPWSEYLLIGKPVIKKAGR